VDPGTQENAPHQAYYSNTNPGNNKEKHHTMPPKMLVEVNATPKPLKLLSNMLLVVKYT